MAKPTDAPGRATAFLSGGGEMGARIRAHDWERTPLGSPERWPRSLKTAVRIMLTSRQPMFVWWGPELINLYNDPYSEVLSGKHPAALGRPAEHVWREIWPQVEPRATSALRRNEGTFDEGLLLVMERKGYPEETYFTFSYSPVPDDDGGTGGIFCACTDDTLRILGERRLALLRELSTAAANARTVADACTLCARALETNPHDLPFAALYLCDPDGKTLHLAGTAGIAPGHAGAPHVLERAAARPWPLDAAPDGTLPQLATPTPKLHATLPGGAWDRPPDVAAVVPIARSGETGPSGVLIAGLNPFRPFDEAYGDFLSLVSSQIAATIGSAHSYEEERRRAETLAELDRAKTVFFSNVSHEFRTPLTLMLGPIADLRAADDGTHRDALDLLQRNAQRLQRLVNALLDFSRIEAGRMRARFAATDLATYTAELASTFRSACEKAGLTLDVTCPPLDEPVWVDREMWEKVVLNLLSNAFKFTLAGGIRVELASAGDEVVLSVADTGSGIAPVDLSHVFERFRRVEGVAARTHEGTGIGLALVQELVRMHGGRVDVESTLGRGTTFRVVVPKGCAHLPADQRVEAHGDAVATGHAESYLEAALGWLPDGADGAPVSPAMSWSEASSPESDDATVRPRILVVDDNADMRSYLTRLLRPRFDVETVSDGLAALEAVRRDPPDLVLSDVMMPRLDGVGLLRALRADDATRTIPIVLLSARAGEDAYVEGLAHGADDYLVKPFSAGELLARVGARIELVRARHSIDEALRESEQRFRHMADHAPVMVWVTEPDGRCTFISRSWYDFTGQPDGAGLGAGWLDAVHEDDREAVGHAFDDATARRAAFRQEYRLRHVDGSYRWALDAAAPRFAADGTYLGLIGSVIDITERKRAEDAMREADRRKDEFLATLAHELRNPLAPMRNALHVLRMSGTPDAAAERLNAMMERQVDHMVRLVDDLLEVSRITRGKFELRPEPIDLAAVVRAAIETSRPLIDVGGHGLEVVPPDEPITLYADPVRLAQVIGNLLNNAAKYTPRNGHIRIVTRRSGDEIEIAVSDDGVGIPPEMLSRVFDLFAQVDRTRAAAQGGLGIGLTLVRRIVELHGGRVDAVSDGPGRGSTFRVLLPAASAPGSVRVDDANAAALMSARRHCVLIVDDNVDAAESLAMLLRFLGADVAIAHDGPSALRRLETLRPTLILLDIGMPGMDGYEVAAHVRAMPHLDGVRLIALSGWGQTEDRRRSERAGFDEHYVKPIELAALQGLLQAS